MDNVTEPVLEAKLELPPALTAIASREIELKFLATPDMLEQVRQAPAVTRHAMNTGLTRRLETTYYDTPDRILFGHGLSLRVRRAGTRYVQTLKRAPTEAQPFARGQWESPVDGGVPDLGRLPLAEADLLPDMLDPAALAPIFVTRFRRRTQRLLRSGSVIEIAFDEGSIEAGDRSEPLTEIEIELKSGESRVLYDLGQELLEIAPLRLGTRSKSDRGYALAFALAPHAIKASVPAISAWHTVDDVVGTLIGSCQHQLLANQAVAEAGRDPEGIHQMRVALRRLRTACGLLNRELGSPALAGFAAEAKWVASALGPAREWDVFVSDTLRGPARALGTEFDREGLCKAAEPYRQAAYAALHEVLGSQRYNQFQLSLRHWIECRGWRNDLENRSLAALLEPAPAFASRVMVRLHRKALKQGRHFDRLDPEGRHEVRIALKKLRYATQFFDGVYGATKPVREFGFCLAKLQDVLGHANDGAMTEPLLRRLAVDPVPGSVQRAIGALAGWQARDRIALARKLVRHWRRFKAMPAYWPG
jgi:inorganic triphosphatase YgiF